jgi:hypothetical protein
MRSPAERSNMKKKMEVKEVQQLGQSKQQLKAIQDFFKSTWA